MIPEELRASVDRLAAIIADAPPVDVTLDQCPCVPETAMLRALLMLKNGALEGRRVLILGDDNSLSVAIGLAGRALRQGDLTRGVTVIESDPRRVAFLRAAAASEEIAIDVVAHDLRDPAAGRGSRGAFDVVATDPPYTLAGANLFLGRGAEALTGDGACYFSFTQWPASQLAELQRLFLDLGFAVRAVHQGFNRYLGASVLGNVGDLIELAQVRAARRRPAGLDAGRSTPPRSTGARVSMCARACGAETVLGDDGAPATIEALKAAGCHACGGKVFRRRAGEPATDMTRSQHVGHPHASSWSRRSLRRSPPRRRRRRQPGRPRPLTLVVPFAAGRADGHDRTHPGAAPGRAPGPAGDDRECRRRRRHDRAPRGSRRRRPTAISSCSAISAPTPQNQTLYKHPLYDAATDFAPVALIAETPLVLIARKDLPADDLPAFIAYARANQAKMQFGSGGAGSATHHRLRAAQCGDRHQPDAHSLSRRRARHAGSDRAAGSTTCASIRRSRCRRSRAAPSRRSRS